MGRVLEFKAPPWVHTPAQLVSDVREAMLTDL